jgi:predicted nucleic acid-binding protein
MTTPSEPVFVDTNVLVFSTITTANQHAAARDKLAELRAASVPMWLSRQVLREYAVVLTRPQSFSVPLPASAVSADIRHFMGVFNLAEDGTAVTEKLLWLLENVPIGGKQIHDANIVATMLCYGIPRLLTDDTGDFNRFSSLITIMPLT